MQTKLPNLTSHAVDVAEQVHTAGFSCFGSTPQHAIPILLYASSFLNTYIVLWLRKIFSTQYIGGIQTVLLSACSFAGSCFQNLRNPNVIMLRVRCSNLPGEAGSPFCSLNPLGTPFYSDKPWGSTVRKRTKTMENMNSWPLIWNCCWFCNYFYFTVEIIPYQKDVVSKNIFSRQRYLTKVS